MEREARKDLLDSMHDADVSVDELRKAVEEERLALLPVEIEQQVFCATSALVANPGVSVKLAPGWIGTGGGAQDRHHRGGRRRRDLHACLR